MYIIRRLPPNELWHHGVKGQKWGLRRFQNPDGTLTEAGKKRYNIDDTNSIIGRALFNTSSGQKLAVTFNKGFKEDKKQIKEEYKKNLETMDKEQAKILKERAESEARLSAANAIYSYQSKEANKIIQTQSLGSSIAKTLVMGPYGSLVYTKLRNPKDKASMHAGKAAVVAIAANMGNTFTNGVLSYSEYAYNATNKKSNPAQDDKPKREHS